MFHPKDLGKEVNDAKRNDMTEVFQALFRQVRCIRKNNGRLEWDRKNLDPLH